MAVGSSMRLGMIPNTAGVNHSRCYTNTSIQWSRSCLPVLNIEDGYIFTSTTGYFLPHLKPIRYQSSCIDEEHRTLSLLILPLGIVNVVGLLTLPNFRFSWYTSIFGFARTKKLLFIFFNSTGNPIHKN